MRIALLHISWVLRWSDISIIHPETFTSKDIFINTLRLGEIKKCPRAVIFVSDNFKNNYLLLSP